MAATLDRRGLSADLLIALPLDKRVGAINAAIEAFVPAAERAAVAGELFREEGFIAMARIETATLRQSTEDVLAFGFLVFHQRRRRLPLAGAERRGRTAGRGRVHGPCHHNRLRQQRLPVPLGGDPGRGGRVDCH